MATLLIDIQLNKSQKNMKNAFTLLRITQEEHEIHFLLNDKGIVSKRLADNFVMVLADTKENCYSY